jgi:hypothetical protein
MKRRSFLKGAAATGALAGLGDLGFLSQLPPVSAAEARLDSKMVQLHPEIEPLVRLLENTPRARLLEEVASRIQHGLTYREVLAALLLAGVRNIQPRPVGFKFHAVLVVNSAHLASLASPDSDRWLPIFWALDQFKVSQAADEKEGDWTMGPIEESSLPPSHKAKAAFIEAMDNWDESAADAAVASLARTAGAHDLFEIFSRYGGLDGLVANVLTVVAAAGVASSATRAHFEDGVSQGRVWWTAVLCEMALATVVIGGLITSTALTLFVLPAICSLVLRRHRVQRAPSHAGVTASKQLGHAAE